MSSAELAALITALGVSIAGIITAIAALRNANYSAAKVRDLEIQITALKTDNDTLRRENTALKIEIQNERNHSQYQDKIIIEQQIKIDKWGEWGDKMGKAMNRLQLESGALAQQMTSKADKKKTGPLPKLD